MVQLNLRPGFRLSVLILEETVPKLVHTHARIRRGGGEKATVAASEAWGMRGFESTVLDEKAVLLSSHPAEPAQDA